MSPDRDDRPPADVEAGVTRPPVGSPAPAAELTEADFSTYEDYRRAVARYRVTLSRYVEKGVRLKSGAMVNGYVRSEVSRGWTHREALAECERLQALVPVNLVRRMGDPLYGIELTNGWQSLSEFARARMLLLGKKPADFDC